MCFFSLFLLFIYPKQNYLKLLLCVELTLSSNSDEPWNINNMTLLLQILCPCQNEEREEKLESLIPYYLRDLGWTAQGNFS